MSILVTDQQRDGERQIIWINGELDLSTVDDLITAGKAALADPDIHTAVVDLAGVEFIDSTGLGALVQLHNTAPAHDSSPTLRGATEQTLKIMRLTNLDTLLMLEPSADPS